MRSDAQVLAEFRDGNDDAFAVLHARYQRRLFAYVRRMLATSPREDAEDALQDVFVRAYGHLRRDARDIHVRAWLYRVAHNRCLDHLCRRPMPARELFEASRRAIPDTCEEAQRRERLRDLVDEIDRLPARQRAALVMREVEGRSYADVADVLDTTVPAVKSLLVRARMTLGQTEVGC